MNVEEFNISVPWGLIAGKAWGRQSNKPILVTHGRTDNAGSFERLIPLLPKSFYYICIDLPSHGRSSPLPPFFPIHQLDFLIVYKLVADYFNRGKYILLGHSFGAGIGNYFSRFYPEYVEKVIEIDTFAPFFPVEKFRDHLRLIFDACLTIHQKTNYENRPTYTMEEAINKIRLGRWGTPLTVEAATPLAKRILEPAGHGKFYIQYERRLKYVVPPVNDLEYMKETFRLYPITSPYLLILCKKSSQRIPKIDVVLNEIRKWRKVKVHWIDADHDVHMTDPETVAPIISKFLLESETKL